jgi:PAS domain S-box-containing protein
MTDVVARAHPDRPSGARNGDAVLDGSGQPTSWLTSNLVALGLAGLVAIVAAGVLVGWALGWPLLTSWSAGAVQTKVNAGICLLLLAVALASVVAPLPGRASQVLAVGLGLIVVAVAGATLFEHLSGVDLGIDQAFVTDRASASSPHPGRFAVQTSIAFLSAALALLAMGRTVRRVYPSEILGIVCGCIGGVGVLGYMFGATALASASSASQVSIPTSCALALLGTAVITANPEHRVVRLLSDPGAAGQVIRVFLPAAILVVPAGAWLRLWGERAGLYDETIGLTLMVAFEALILTSIGAWTTLRVQRLETERAEARRDRDRFFELTADLVCVADADGRLVLASPSWQRVLGYPVSEITSRPLVDFMHPDDREATLAGLASALVGTGRAYSFQNRYRSADGNYRWLEWNSIADPASGRVYAVARDVTERMQADAALARLAAIVESSSDGIVAVDPGGLISEWNAGAAALFGYTAAEAIGQDLTFTAPEDERAQQLERLAEAAAGRPQVYETFRRRKDGSQFRALVTLFPISGRDGAQLGVSTIVHDVSDSYEARRLLEQNSKELARSNSDLEQFAYVASHDLQEPLRMVTGFMGLLQKRHGNTLGDEADEYIGFAVDGARRMQGLIDDLLTYSRVGSRGGSLVAVNLGDVATSASQNLRTLIEETGASIRQDELPTVTADRQQMGQLYQNLIGNAAKFHGDRPPEIELGSQRKHGEWHFYVRDHGIGIPPEHRENIFVIFRRLHSREEYPGSGIGLAVCKRIVERHGGRIWVDTTVGGGCTFWFTLPDRTRSGGDE